MELYKCSFIQYQQILQDLSRYWKQIGREEMESTESKTAIPEKQKKEKNSITGRYNEHSEFNSGALAA